MTMGPNDYFELLNRRLTLLDKLAGELQTSNEALVRLDLEEMHRQVDRQEGLCREIQSLDRSLDELQKKCGAEIRPDGASDDERLALNQMLGRVAEAQAGVRVLNRKHAALLRRSRRTLDAMLNFVRSTSPTYSDPRRVGQTAGVGK